MELMGYEDRPLFSQIAQAIEDGILSGAFAEETQVPSTTELSTAYKINPATALKGMNLLTERGILYKKRGLGMFVATGAAKRIMEARREDFFEHYVKTLLAEAKKLGLDREAIKAMIERGYEG